MELGIANPVPALNAPAVPPQLQQGFWVGPEAGEESVSGFERLAAAGPIAITCTIQLVPLHVSRMCSGACLAQPQG